MIDKDYIDQTHIIIEQPKKKRKPVRLKGIFYIVFTLAIAALLGFNFYNQTQINRLVENNTKLQGLLDVAVVETKLVSNDVVQLQNMMKAYSTELHNQQLMLNDLSKLTQNPGLQLKLAHLENLINIAETKLKINRDVESAKVVLTIAENYLYDDQHPQLIALRKNILMAIEQLADVKSPDLLRVSVNLDKFINLINAVDALDLMIDKQKFNQDLNNTKAPINNADDWRTGLTNFKNDLLNLVSVHKLDDQHGNKLNRLLNAEQIYNLKLYFKLKASQASTSLYQYDANNYLAVLKILEDDVNMYFANNEKLKLQLLELLNNCKETNLTFTLPDLSSLYSEIRKVNK